MTDQQANRLREVVKTLQRITDAAFCLSRPEGDEDPTTWGTAKANDVVSNLKKCAELMYVGCLELQELFPTTFEMTAESATFLKGVGVPLTVVAERADVSRPTLYAMLDRHQVIVDAVIGLRAKPTEDRG